MKKLFLLPALLLLYSCEGFRCADGTVVDKDTGLPIDSVAFEVLTNNDWVIYSDSTGKFDACNAMGNCSFGCPDIEVRIFKEGYKEQYFKNPQLDLKIYLERQ